MFEAHREPLKFGMCDALTWYFGEPGDLAPIHRRYLPHWMQVPALIGSRLEALLMSHT